jgi:hypothetical protein
MQNTHRNIVTKSFWISPRLHKPNSYKHQFSITPIQPATLFSLLPSDVDGGDEDGGDEVTRGLVLTLTRNVLRRASAACNSTIALGERFRFSIDETLLKIQSFLVNGPSSEWVGYETSILNTDFFIVETTPFSQCSWHGLFACVMRRFSRHRTSLGQTQ